MKLFQTSASAFFHTTNERIVAYIHPLGYLFIHASIHITLRLSVHLFFRSIQLGLLVDSLNY